jgi:antitoxin (DNA-binding transcriptional repressor) of toxin-antitoxin stability system
MSDHKRGEAGAPAAGRIGVRELKTHAARILGHVRESGASYVVTHRGRTIGVILPVDSEEGGTDMTASTDTASAWEAFLRAGRRLEKRFRPGVSGVQALADMRNKDGATGR